MNEAVAANSTSVALSESAGATQETDVWWGSYSGWTMLPSLLICVALTAAIVWGAWRFVERRHLQWTIWSLAGAVWLVQGGRWSVRVFGHNYRLTTRRLFILRGHLWQRRLALDLERVAQVKVRWDALGHWTKVGRIVVFLDQGATPAVLEGVRHPERVAASISDLSASAKERGPR